MPSAGDAITALVMAYAERLDAGDLDGVAALFAHATWRSSAGGEPRRGTAAVRRVYDGVILYDGSPRTRHVVSNLVIDVVYPGHATVRSYFTVFQTLPGFPLQAIAAGRYHDAFECADGSWRFADRLILLDLPGDLSRHLRAG